MTKRKKPSGLSSPKEKLYDTEYKSNLVLRPDGQAVWDKKIWNWEPGKNLVKKRRYDDPVKPSGNFKQKKEADKDLKWILPRSFCPDCKRNDIPVHEQEAGTSGVFVFIENHPECDITIEDVVIYGRCGPCLSGWRHRAIKLSELDEAKYQYRKMEHGILDYIKQQKLRGETAIEDRRRD